MENEKNILREQQAPLKNHDDAFVKVGRNGEPVIPDTTDDEKKETKESDHSTTLDKR